MGHFHEFLGLKHFFSQTKRVQLGISKCHSSAKLDNASLKLVLLFANFLHNTTLKYNRTIEKWIKIKIIITCCCSIHSFIHTYVLDAIFIAMQIFWPGSFIAISFKWVNLPDGPGQQLL